MRTGDQVTVTAPTGAQVEAFILLASPNGKSLMLTFQDAMFIGYVGMMPVLEDEEGTFRDLITGTPLTLTPKLKPVCTHRKAKRNQMTTRCPDCGALLWNTVRDRRRALGRKQR